MDEKPGQPLKVLFVAAEAEPFVKVGGLGDVAGSLPLTLRSLPPIDSGGRFIDARLILPFHPVITAGNLKVEKITGFNLEAGTEKIRTAVYKTDLQGMPVYLIDGRPVRKRKTVYSQNALLDADKFIFFSLAVLEFCRRGFWVPDILHVNDWHTALIPHLLKSSPGHYSSLAAVRTVLTIHNLPFMGAGIESSLGKYGIQPSKDHDLPKWARYFPLPMGLSAANRVTTVSPYYAAELYTEEYGCGLQDYLKTIASKISGILNGIDTSSWNPETDGYITMKYSAGNLERRTENRTALIKEFDLDPDLAIPLLSFIGRMDIQKGIDLFLDSLPALTGLPWQCIIIGSGARELEDKTRELEVRFPNRIKAVIRYDAALSHRLYAGADLLIVPSRYEPCGLVQMIAMRYGCVPVASAVGGLVDTIDDHPARENSSGYLFTPPQPSTLEEALQRAFTDFANKPAWKRMQINGMEKIFSWDSSAREYAQLYLEERRAEL